MFLCLQVLYALTAGIAGYVSAVQYKTMGGTNWVGSCCPCVHNTWQAASLAALVNQPLYRVNLAYVHICRIGIHMAFPLCADNIVFCSSICMWHEIAWYKHTFGGLAYKPFKSCALPAGADIVMQAEIGLFECAGTQCAAHGGSLLWSNAHLLFFPQHSRHRLSLHSCAAFWNHLHHLCHLGTDYLSLDSAWRHCRQE